MQARPELEAILAKLRAIEERYRLLVDMIPQDIWTTDAKGSHSDWRPLAAVGAGKNRRTGLTLGKAASRAGGAMLARTPFVPRGV